MIYYDIHTHKIPKIRGYENDDIVSVHNIELCNFFEISDILDTSSILLSCGIHPWYIEDGTQKIEKLKEIINIRNIIAIGECGLDKLHDKNIKNQINIFSQQIELAIDVDKPMIIHCVKAWDELIALYKKYKPRKNWIIHGFRGNASLARQLCNLGFYLSFGEKFNTDALRGIPIEHIFLESDMSEIPIYETYNKIATVLNENLINLTDILSGNFANTFNTI